MAVSIPPFLLFGGRGLKILRQNKIDIELLWQKQRVHLMTTQENMEQKSCSIQRTLAKKEG